MCLGQSVCMCVRMYVRMHVTVCIHMQVRIRMYMCECVAIVIRVGVQVHMCSSAEPAGVYADMQVYNCAYVNDSMGVYVYVWAHRCKRDLGICLQGRPRRLWPLTQDRHRVHPGSGPTAHKPLLCHAHGGAARRRKPDAPCPPCFLPLPPCQAATITLSFFHLVHPDSRVTIATACGYLNAQTHNHWVGQSHIITTSLSHQTHHHMHDHGHLCRRSCSHHNRSCSRQPWRHHW